MNCFDGVKIDPNLACLSFDWKMIFAFGVNCSGVSESFVCAPRMQWVFSTGWASEMVDQLL